VILAGRQVGDAERATPTRHRIVGWVARGQAEPTPPIVQVAATVLDTRRHPDACGSAAGLGGDVGGTDQIPMPEDMQ
jgi:hypothetical protein